MITQLRLRDFRNYKDSTFDFTTPHVVFFGPNGRGKTNILEALSVASVGKSWRESSGKDLIRFEAEASSAIVNIVTDDEVHYQVRVEPRRREFRRNDKVTSLKKHITNLPTLLFAPEHLQLFSGPKRDRQRFFDRFLFQLYPSYREVYSRCQKALRNRNALLRSAQEQGAFSSVLEEQLLPWNKLLAETIPQIIVFRQDFATALNKQLSSCLQSIAEKEEPLSMRLDIAEDYEPTAEGVQDFFVRMHRREVAAGRTLIGPQRDDFLFMLREKPLVVTASRGEERSVLLALLAAKKHLFHETVGVIPAMLLDDVFSELDQERQDRLSYFCEGAQVFFTTTHDSHFEGFGQTVQSIHIV